MNKLLAVLLLAGATLAPSAGLTHSHKRKSLEIVHPYTMEMLKKETTTAQVFMVIKNSGGTPERLISASTPRAAKVDLFPDDNAAADRKAVAPFTIGPGKSLVLGPKEQHLVLTGVKRAFTAYDEFKMTLVFEKAGRMVVDVMVEEASTDEPHKH